MELKWQIYLIPDMPSFFFYFFFFTLNSVSQGIDKQSWSRHSFFHISVYKFTKFRKWDMIHEDPSVLAMYNYIDNSCIKFCVKLTLEIWIIWSKNYWYNETMHIYLCVYHLSMYLFQFHLDYLFVFYSISLLLIPTGLPVIPQQHPWKTTQKWLNSSCWD